MRWMRRFSYDAELRPVHVSGSECVLLLVQRHAPEASDPGWRASMVAELSLLKMPLAKVAFPRPNTGHSMLFSLCV